MLLNIFKDLLKKDCCHLFLFVMICFQQAMAVICW